VPAVKASPRHRNRAQRLAELLDHADGSRRHHRRPHRAELDASLLPLVGFATRLRRMPFEASAVMADPEFKASLRSVLVSAADRQAGREETHDLSYLGERRRGSAPRAVPAPAPRTGSRGRTRAAVLVGVTAGALALSGVSAASDKAMPGDALYNIKRSTEKAQLALAGSDLSRGQLLLQFAQIRLQEAATVGPDLLPGVLADMDDEASQGVRLLLASAKDHHSTATLDRVDDFVRTQQLALTNLVTAANAGDANRIARSLQQLVALGTQSRQLRLALS
jgi:Domain of unknown function (DUF5667)